MKMFIQAAAIVLLGASLAQAQVPPDIAKKLKETGPVVDPPGTAKLYRPLQPSAPYPGVKVLRNQSYGWHARHVVDVFEPAGEPGTPRPVLIYVAGGGGNKIEQVPDGEAFYDNIMLWAVKNGMVGVNMQRLAGQGRAWDDPARDVGMVVYWVQQNIAKHQGSPDRVFIWAHSAGTGPVSAYVSQPQTHGPKGVGLKGAILMGGNLNIAPIAVNVPPPPGPGRGNAPDPATQLARSNLPGFRSTPVALFFGAGEVDTPGAVAFVNTARPELCRNNKCQAVIFKDHSHMSSVFSPNTEDDTVTGPILKWMRSVK